MCDVTLFSPSICMYIVFNSDFTCLPFKVPIFLNPGGRTSILSVNNKRFGDFVRISRFSCVRVFRVFLISILSQILKRSFIPVYFPSGFSTSVPSSLRSHFTSAYAIFLIIPPDRSIIVFATCGLKMYIGSLIYPHL